MKFRPPLIALILALVLGIAGVTPYLKAAMALPGDLKPLSYEAAIKKAALEKKTTLVYFWADWCPNCRSFNETTLPDANVLKTLADSFAVVSVDTTSDPEKLAQKYQIRTIPAFVFLDSTGEPISVLPGAVNTDIFLLVLNYISSGAYVNMEFEEFVTSLLK
jgi:thioredoxin-related protein